MLALGCASTEIVRDTMTIQEVGDDATTAGSDSSGRLNRLAQGMCSNLKFLVRLNFQEVQGVEFW